MITVTMFRYILTNANRAFFVTLLGITLSNVIYAQQPTNTETPSRQCGVLAKVLAESLDKADIGEWPAAPMGLRSPFASGIRADYLPTVGVLVNLTVSFPIAAPAEGNMGEAAPKEPQDLWEKYAAEPFDVFRGDDKGIQKIRKRTTSSHEPGEVNIVLPGSGIRGEVRMFGSASSMEGKEEDNTASEVAEDFILDSRLPVLEWRTSAKYDPDKVSRMRDTILSVLAEYGHRLTCLQNDERVLVVVESPRASKRHQESVERTGTNEEIRKALLLRFDPEMEHLLIAVPRDAIASKTSRDVLLPRIVEKKY